MALPCNYSEGFYATNQGVSIMDLRNIFFHVFLTSKTVSSSSSICCMSGLLLRPLPHSLVIVPTKSYKSNLEQQLYTKFFIIKHFFAFDFFLHVEKLNTRKTFLLTFIFISSQMVFNKRGQHKNTRERIAHFWCVHIKQNKCIIKAWCIHWLFYPVMANWCSVAHSCVAIFLEI